MSTGLVICSECHREAHQRGTWYHCDDKSALCAGATLIYPQVVEEIVGAWCGADDSEGRFIFPRRTAAHSHGRSSLIDSDMERAKQRVEARSLPRRKQRSKRQHKSRAARQRLAKHSRKRNRS